MAQARVTTIFGADITALQQATGKAGQSLEKFKNDNVSKIGGMVAGAFAVNSLVSFAKQAIDTAGKINDMSSSLEISTDALQGLVALGKDNGLGQDQLFSGLAKLKDAQSSLVEGNKTAEAAFKRFGISAKEAISSDTASLLEKIAVGAKDNASAFDDLNTIFGKGGGKDFSNMLGELADTGLQKTIDKYKELGLVIDNGLIIALDKAGDSVERATTKIGNKLVIFLGTLSDFFNDAGSVFYTGLFKYWDDITSGDLKKIGKASIGISAVEGLIDGYQGVKNNELGSGAERKKAEQNEANKKAAEQKRRDAASNKLDQNQGEQEFFDFIDALEKQMIEERKADKKISDLDKDYEKDYDKIMKQGGAKQNVSEAVSLGRLSGGNYQISLAERQLKVNEDIKQLNEKHNEKLDKINEKLDE